MTQDERELLLRKLLWLNHGCTFLYGDDGEMQCGKCLIDFKRDDPKLIERKLMLRHGRFVQTEHGEIFVPNDILREKEEKMENCKKYRKDEEAKMDEKVKEIEEKYRILKEEIYPPSGTVEVLQDVMIHKFFDEKVQILLSHITLLESQIVYLLSDRKLCEVCFQTPEPDGSCLTCRLAEKVQQLKKGIEDFLDHCHSEDHSIPDWVMGELKKLVEEK